MLGYTDIQATGLSIISEGILRQEIIQYYSRVENNMAWAQEVQKYIDEYIAPRIITDFEDYNFLEKGIPIDFSKLRSDKIFLNVLKKLERLNVVSLERLESQKQHAEKFSKHLHSNR